MGLAHHRTSRASVGSSGCISTRTCATCNRGRLWAAAPPSPVSRLLHVVQAHAFSADYPQSLAYWERLRGAAITAAHSASGADLHPQAVAEQWLHQQQRVQPLAATAVAAPQTTKTQAPTTAGLVRSRVVKNRRGYWRIRHFQPSDLLAVADLQAAAFYESMCPLSAVDKLAFTMFKAEVLDALKKKVSVLSDDSFAMMVVESCQLGSMDAAAADSISTDSDSDTDSSGDWDWDTAVWYGDQQAATVPTNGSSTPATVLQDKGSNPLAHRFSQNFGTDNIMGVVEVGVEDAGDVLKHLDCHSGSYAYISSMAVSHQIRCSGIGRALLHAADQQAANWNQSVVALHVYTTNAPAIRLYERHGMRCQAQDPAWRGLLGAKVRQLMVKDLRGNGLH